MAETVKGLNIKLTLDGKDLENELNGIKKYNLDLIESFLYIHHIELYMNLFGLGN